MKSGFVSIIGKPNVGKSTLINTLIGQKIAIMSPKPQTTRNTIQGIYNDKDSQIIFIDTPGIHNPKTELGVYMTNMAYESISGVDIIIFMIDDKDKLDIDLKIIEKLKKTHKKVILVINKLDLINKNGILDGIILKYMSHYNFDACIPISAKYNKNIDYLIKEIKESLDEGPKYFPDGIITDHPERFLISEIIREKILYLTEQEIPHSVCVVVENTKFDDKNPDLLNISAEIIVERDSQKKIIIGKNGEMIKKIGMKSRKELINLLGNKIYLELYVRVKKDWKNRKTDLKNFGYYEN